MAKIIIIYSLFSAMLFPPYAIEVLFFFYLLVLDVNSHIN